MLVGTNTALKCKSKDRDTDREGVRALFFEQRTTSFFFFPPQSRDLSDFTQLPLEQHIFQHSWFRSSLSEQNDLWICVSFMQQFRFYFTTVWRILCSLFREMFNNLLGTTVRTGDLATCSNVLFIQHPVVTSCCRSCTICSRVVKDKLTQPDIRFDMLSIWLRW